MLEDVLSPNLRLVICGAAVGRKSADHGEYYADPSNKFWNILAEVCLTPYVLEPSKFVELLSFGIGLTDIVKDRAGRDDEIDFARATPGELRKKLLRLRPKILCFNGKRAAKVFFGRKSVDYGLQRDMVGDTKIFVAPSTSSAANRWWDAALWEELAQLLRRL